MFKRLLMALLVLVAAILGLAATKPDTFHVERRVTVKAPPEKILARLQDFRRWADWSPWERLDPAMTREFSGAPAGVGAVYEWRGNDKVGAGRMEITDITVPSHLVVKLDFVRPIEGHNTADFTLLPVGEGTEVSWAMRGPSPFISKVLQVFFSMDKMIGKDFEAGLASLKTVSER